MITPDNYTRYDTGVMEGNEKELLRVRFKKVLHLYTGLNGTVETQCNKYPLKRYLLKGIS
jgi:hypothetical protein